MGHVTILPETTINPISLIGQRAGVCWMSDTEDAEKNYKRGLKCIQSGHGRTLEFVNVEMVLDGYSARVMREWYTHIGGMPTRLQESTRYIDYSHFDYVIPPWIEQNDRLHELYKECMDKTSDIIKLLQSRGAKREDIAMLLPLGMKTKVIDKRNLRNIADMSHQRMCTRAYWEYRELFRDIIDALNAYSREWSELTPRIMFPKCELTGLCPEEHGCGRHPRKLDK